jgi:L-2-hydroxyglutarate oxidase LhgO
MNVAVVGGGIVGLATAHELLRRGAAVTLFEKETTLAAHQTGHNSGVIHSGVYYKSGSAKARLCVRGGAMLREFCDENGVPWRACGKLIVARTAEELPRLDEIYRRGVANGVPRLALLDRFDDVEPYAAGIRALHVPTAAVVDYRAVAAALGLSKRAFTRALQSLVPSIEPDDLVRAPAGVRAQALTRGGALVEDFAIVERGGALHVLNAPSPAATASLAIAEEIADALG